MLPYGYNLPRDFKLLSLDEHIQKMRGGSEMQDCAERLSTSFKRGEGGTRVVSANARGFVIDGRRICKVPCKRSITRSKRKAIVHTISERRKIRTMLKRLSALPIWGNYYGTGHVARKKFVDLREIMTGWRIFVLSLLV